MNTMLNTEEHIDTTSGLPEAIINSNQLFINITSHLDLVIVKGTLNGAFCGDQFTKLKKDIELHFLHSNSLNLFINLAYYDLMGMKALFSLASSINQGVLKGHEITVYWNTQNKVSMHKMAMVFDNTIICDLHISDK